MKDPIIRASLVNRLKVKYKAPKDILVSEMGLCGGSSRIDLAVINGSLHGYEIKSDSDTLVRLPNQLREYRKYFSYISVVTTNKHLERVLTNSPEWVGIKLAKDTRKGICFEEIRKPMFNMEVEKESVVQLLWRDEAFDILCKLGCEKGFSSKPKRKIWGKLSDVLSLEEITKYVKSAIRQRTNWQPVLSLL